MDVNNITQLVSLRRGDFGQLLSYPEWVKTLIAELDGQAWTTGIASDKKQRGSSINVDVYAFDNAQSLAIVQVRECVFHPRRWNRVRKDYYLIGRNENGNAFAHPVDSVARSKSALATPEGGVRFALMRIWDCTESQLSRIVRNGDVALIPLGARDEKRVSGQWEQWEGNQVLVADSHLVEAPEFYTCGAELYARGRVTIRHIKGQHPTVTGEGLWRIQHGLRADTWSFTTPTAD